MEEINRNCVKKRLRETAKNQNLGKGKYPNFFLENITKLLKIRNLFTI